jgi:hypothetical protein
MLASITKEWKTGRLFKKRIKVHAQQVEMPKEYGGLTALAKVTIEVNGKIVHEADIPWAMPKAGFMLAIQVYMLSKQPDYAHPEWQPILEQFAFKCEGFTPPARMWWSKEPLLD